MKNTNFNSVIKRNRYFKLIKKVAWSQEARSNRFYNFSCCSREKYENDTLNRFELIEFFIVAKVLRQVFEQMVTISTVEHRTGE